MYKFIIMIIEVNNGKSASHQKADKLSKQLWLVLAAQRNSSDERNIFVGKLFWHHNILSYCKVITLTAQRFSDSIKYIIWIKRSLREAHAHRKSAVVSSFAVLFYSCCCSSSIKSHLMNTKILCTTSKHTMTPSNEEVSKTSGDGALSTLIRNWL